MTKHFKTLESDTRFSGQVNMYIADRCVPWGEEAKGLTKVIYTLTLCGNLPTGSTLRLNRRMYQRCTNRMKLAVQCQV